MLRAMFRASMVATATLLFSTSAFAASPKATVEKMFAEIKAAKSMVAIVEHVHWKTMYETFPPEERRVAGADSPEKLKAHFREFFTNPGKRMRQMMEIQLASMPAEQSAAVRAQLDQQMPQINALAKEQNAKMLKTVMKVTGSKVEGDTATVNVSATRDGETKTDTITLKKYGKRWMLPNLAALGQSSGKGGFAPPPRRGAKSPR